MSTAAAEVRLRSAATWVVVVALAALPVIWLSTFLLGPQTQDAAYVIGRYSLLLGGIALVALVVERARGRTPVAASTAVVMAYVGVLLGRVLGTGAATYPWLIAIAALLATVGAVAPGSRRRWGAAPAVALWAAVGIGLLGLA